MDSIGNRLAGKKSIVGLQPSIKRYIHVVLNCLSSKVVSIKEKEIILSNSAYYVFGPNVYRYIVGLAIQVETVK